MRPNRHILVYNHHLTNVRAVDQILVHMRLLMFKFRSTLTSTLIYTTSITHTIPAPSSFTPIQASLHNSTYNKFGSIDYKSHSGLTHLYSKPDDLKNLVPIGLTYPQGVRCHVWEPESRCLTTTKTSVSTVIETPFISLKTVCSSCSLRLRAFRRRRAPRICDAFPYPKVVLTR